MGAGPIALGSRRGIARSRPHAVARWTRKSYAATVPAADAARPLAEGGCPLVRTN